jgi:hypothetical protein
LERVFVVACIAPVAGQPRRAIAAAGSAGETAGARKVVAIEA